MRLPRLKRLLAVLAVAVAAFLIIVIIIGGGDKSGDFGYAVLIETDFGTSSEPIADAIFGKPSPAFLRFCAPTHQATGRVLSRRAR